MKLIKTGEECSTDKTSSMTRVNIRVFTSPNFIDLWYLYGSQVVKKVSPYISYREANIVIRIIL